ncbi:hypothetical protein SRHO_G00345760 [Serrasalmus rhombeus]
MTVLTQSQAAISVAQKVVTVMELIPEMLTHPTLDDTARHFFSSESAGIPARHMKLIPCGDSAGLTRIRIRSESYLGPRGGLALQFSWATHDF